MEPKYPACHGGNWSHNLPGLSRNLTVLSEALIYCARHALCRLFLAQVSAEHRNRTVWRDRNIIMDSNDFIVVEWKGIDIDW